MPRPAEILPRCCAVVSISRHNWLQISMKRNVTLFFFRFPVTDSTIFINFPQFCGHWVPAHGNNNKTYSSNIDGSKKGTIRKIESFLLEEKDREIERGRWAAPRRETLKREIELSAFFRPSYARAALRSERSLRFPRETHKLQKSPCPPLRLSASPFPPPSFSRELRITAGSSSSSATSK